MKDYFLTIIKIVPRGTIHKIKTKSKSMFHVEHAFCVDGEIFVQWELKAK